MDMFAQLFGDCKIQSIPDISNCKGIANYFDASIIHYIKYFLSHRISQGMFGLFNIFNNSIYPGSTVKTVRTGFAARHSHFFVLGSTARSAFPHHTAAKQEKI